MASITHVSHWQKSLIRIAEKAEPCKRISGGSAGERTVTRLHGREIVARADRVEAADASSELWVDSKTVSRG
jgi:hypothetical protein